MRLLFRHHCTTKIKKAHFPTPIWVQEKVDWIDYMDAEVMETMLNMEGDVVAITVEEPSNPSAFIVPVAE